MAEDEELERRVRKLAVEHVETRWLALRLDDDVKEIRQELRTMRSEHTARFDAIDRELDNHSRVLEEHSRVLEEHSRVLDHHSSLLERNGVELQEHTGRFDSVEAQLRTLTQMVGQVLERIPEDRG